MFLHFTYTTQVLYLAGCSYQRKYFLQFKNAWQAILNIKIFTSPKIMKSKKTKGKLGAPKI